MIYRDSVTVATYRDQVVGVLITGKESHGHFAPVFRLKKGYHFLRLKFTKEGRKNLEHFNKLQGYEKQLTVSRRNRLRKYPLSLCKLKGFSPKKRNPGKYRLFLQQLLKQISTEKDTELFHIYGPAGSKNLYGKSWFRKEKRGFPDAGAEQKRFRESVALYKKNRVAKHS